MGPCICISSLPETTIGKRTLTLLPPATLRLGLEKIPKLLGPNAKCPVPSSKLRQELGHFSIPKNKDMWHVRSGGTQYISIENSDGKHSKSVGIHIGENKNWVGLL